MAEGDVMTSVEQRTIADLRAHLDRVLMWAGGLILTVAIAVIAWEVGQEQRLTRTSTVAEENARLAHRAMADLTSIREQAARASREVGELQSFLRAQAQSMTEIKDELRALREFLQRGNGTR